MKPIIVKWTIGTGYANANHSGQWEIDREEWDGMSEEEREKMLSEMMEDEIANHIDAGYEVAGED